MPGSWICIDASLVVRLVTDPGDQLVRPQWEQWESDGRRFAAPPLIYFEVTNAIYQYHRHELIGDKSVKLSLEAALSLPIRIQWDIHLHRNALSLAQHHSLAATYDAHYLALAELLEAEFWTMDRRLFKAVGTELPWVKLLHGEVKGE